MADTYGFTRPRADRWWRCAVQKSPWRAVGKFVAIASQHAAALAFAIARSDPDRGLVLNDRSLRRAGQGHQDLLVISPWKQPQRWPMSKARIAACELGVPLRT